VTRGIYARPGWSDEAGPLWFLSPRWSCGPKWRKCWAMFFASDLGVTMQAHTRKGGFAYEGFFVPADLWNDMSYGQKEDMCMSWLREVRRPTSDQSGPDAAADPVWVHEFPALHEYLVVSTHPDGSLRRTSTLTLFAEHGAWKCFFNERHSGASLCATGSSIADCLSALEVMLEQESVPWRFYDKPEQGNGRRRGKGT
jgi:hypothetical protein